MVKKKLTRKVADRKNAPKWDDRFYVKAYILAREGLGYKEIAENLGIRPCTLDTWRKKNDVLEEAIQMGRDNSKKGAWTINTFRDFVLGRLPEHLVEIWEELEECEHAGTAAGRMEALMEKAGARGRQHLFIHALMTGGFTLTTALRKVNINRKQYNRWLEEPEFAELLEEIHLAKKDFIESSLMGLVAQGDRNAVIFASKSINADRGYGEKLNVVHEGKIEHEHKSLIDLNKIRLPLDLRVKLLECIEAQEESGGEPASQDILDAEFVEKSA